MGNTTVTGMGNTLVTHMGKTLDIYNIPQKTDIIAWERDLFFNGLKHRQVIG
jgi:hypothetical protein